MTNEDRTWENAYRNRWRHDKVVRSTHGVNCTGGCSWKIFVKSGLVAFEMQQTDYPRTRDDLPNHEPRGCQRGASFSWYLYSPHRIKYPLVRGRLLDLYRAERKNGKDPVEAWGAIQADPAKHIQHAAKVLLKFKLLETQSQTLESFIDWARGTSYFNLIHQAHCRCGQYLHHQEVGPGPHLRFLADSCDVHAFLRGRLTLSLADRRRLRLLL